MIEKTRATQSHFSHWKLATFILGYLIKVRLHEEIPKSLGSLLLTHILLNISCHFAKETEHTGMMPDLILTAGNSYDCLGSETSDLVTVTQGPQCKVRINNSNSTQYTGLWRR